jgi:UDP-glucose 4,6-dehydratase
MILLLGASGYIGSAFVHELERRKLNYTVPKTIHQNYTQTRWISRTLESAKFDLVINCAAFIPGVVDNCEDHPAETLNSNLVFPAILSALCEASKTPLIHVSTGCLFNGDNGGRGFSELDQPHLGFRTKCGVYVGAKQLAEEAVGMSSRSYICRLRLPFCHISHPRNYLTKLLTYTKVYDNLNSLTNRFEFAEACLHLWKSGSPYGTYNLTNPEAIRAREIVHMMGDTIAIGKRFEFWKDEEFFAKAARTPKSNCVLDVRKAAMQGVTMKNVRDSVMDCLKAWKP